MYWLARCWIDASRMQHAQGVSSTSCIRRAWLEAWHCRAGLCAQAGGHARARGAAAVLPGAAGRRRARGAVVGGRGAGRGARQRGRAGQQGARAASQAYHSGSTHGLHAGARVVPVRTRCGAAAGQRQRGGGRPGRRRPLLRGRARRAARLCRGAFQPRVRACAQARRPPLQQGRALSARGARQGARAAPAARRRRARGVRGCARARAWRSGGRLPGAARGEG